MLKPEHIRQVSTEKIYAFTKELYTQTMKVIDESNGYLNDTEQVMSVILLSKIIYESGEEVLGSESVGYILEHLNKHKGEKNERENDN